MCWKFKIKLYYLTYFLGRHLHCGIVCSWWCIKWRLYCNLRLGYVIRNYFALLSLKNYYWNYRWKPYKTQREKDIMYYIIAQAARIKNNRRRK